MYKKILVPVDGSATSLRGLNEAIGLAKSCGAMLDIVHVVNEQVFDTGYMPAPFYEQLFESQREGGRKVLAAAEEVARRHEVDFKSDLLEVVVRSSPVPVLLVRDQPEVP